MRIGVVTEEWFPAFGAVAEEVRHFAREARRLGHSVKIVTGAPPRIAPRTSSAWARRAPRCATAW